MTTESTEREQGPEYGEQRRCCTVCDVKNQCHVCGATTQWACSDCAIDFGITIHVCASSECRDAHEEKCPRTSTARGIALGLAQAAGICDSYKDETYMLDVCETAKEIGKEILAASPDPDIIRKAWEEGRDAAAAACQTVEHGYEYMTVDRDQKHKVPVSVEACRECEAACRSLKYQEKDSLKQPE